MKHTLLLDIKDFKILIRIEESILKLMQTTFGIVLLKVLV